MLIKFEQPKEIYSLLGGVEYYFQSDTLEKYETLSATGIDTDTGETVVQATTYYHFLEEVYVQADEIIWEEPDQEDEDDDFEEPSYIINKDNVTLTYQGNVLSTNNSNTHFKDIVNLIINGNFEAASKLFTPTAAIESWVSGLLEVRSDKIFYADFEIKGKFVEKIIRYAQVDPDVDSFLNFLKLVMEQEDVQVRDRLLDFAADDSIEFSPEGYVIAYKNVRDDYFDKHSGKFRNMVGDKPSVPRSSVDADHNTTCSRGLHVCSFKYLMRCWGTEGRTMLVYVNPKDFVAVPYDYDDSKARVSQYEVIDELTYDKLEHLKLQHGM